MEQENNPSALAPASSGGGTEAERKQSEEDATRAIVPTGETEGYIPFDVVTNEVLGRTDDVKPLMRMKLVCKEWNHLIRDPEFIENHMKRGKGDLMLYVGLCKDNSPDATPEETFLCGCNGMIVVTKMEGLLIQNPATHEKREVPTPSREAVYRGAMILAFLPTTRRYKLLSFFCDEESDKLSCKVLTVGVDPSWRPVDLQIDDEATCYSYASTGTVAYMLLIPFNRLLGLEEYSTVKLVSFDFETETLTYTVLDTDLIEDWGEVCLTNWNGQGAITCVGKDDISLFLIEDRVGSGHVLSPKQLIPLRGDAKQELGNKSSIHALVAHKDILWVWQRTEMMGFVMETGEVVKKWSIPLNYSHFRHTMYVGAQTLAVVPGMSSMEQGGSS